MRISPHFFGTAHRPASRHLTSLEIFRRFAYPRQGQPSEPACFQDISQPWYVCPPRIGKSKKSSSHLTVLLPSQATNTTTPAKITDWVKPGDTSGEFKRQQSSFRNWISREPGAQYPPEKGRYHLFVSYACPWVSSEPDLSLGGSGRGWRLLTRELAGRPTARSSRGSSRAWRTSSPSPWCIGTWVRRVS